MNKPIVRIYASADAAAAARAKLKGWGFSDDVIGFVTPQSVPGGAFDAAVSAITANWVLRADALVYAKSIQAGRSLVSIRAPFGTGRVAAELLDSVGPVDFGIPEPREGGYDDAAPFSSWIGFPTLSKSGPTAFTSFWGASINVRRSGTTFGGILPELSASDWSFSGGFMPLLSRSPTPLSSSLGLPLLV